MVVTNTPDNHDQMMSKNEMLRSKSPTIALENGIVECVGKLWKIRWEWEVKKSEETYHHWSTFCRDSTPGHFHTVDRDHNRSLKLFASDARSPTVVYNSSSDKTSMLRLLSTIFFYWVLKTLGYWCLLSACVVNNTRNDKTSFLRFYRDPKRSLVGWSLDSQIQR